jgi:hypothetical protein
MRHPSKHEVIISKIHWYIFQYCYKSGLIVFIQQLSFPLATLDGYAPLFYIRNNRFEINYIVASQKGNAFRERFGIAAKYDI